MRVHPLLFVCLAVLALVPGWSGEQRLALLGPDARIVATRVALDPDDPTRRRLGRLTFMGGVALSSGDHAFGGFSALAVRGDRATMLSDGGNVASFTLRRDGQVLLPQFGYLPSGPGTGWDKRDRDSESLAIDPVTGTAWVGFERANAIWRFTPGLAQSRGAVRPAAMRRWWENGGAESLVRRRDGSFVAIAERARGATREGLVWAGDPVAGAPPPFRFRYRPPSGYDPTDAAELPDGRLLVLNRWWGLPLRFRSALVVIDRAAIRPGATVSGDPVAVLGAPLIHGNFEGVAATEEGGHTVLWLVSDNDGVWSPTLLLKFRLD